MKRRSLWVVESVGPDGDVGPIDRPWFADSPLDRGIFRRRKDARAYASECRAEDKAEGMNTEVRVTKYKACKR